MKLFGFPYLYISSRDMDQVSYIDSSKIPFEVIYKPMCELAASAFAVMLAIWFRNLLSYAFCV